MFQSPPSGYSTGSEITAVAPPVIIEPEPLRSFFLIPSHLLAHKPQQNSND